MDSRPVVSAAGVTVPAEGVRQSRMVGFRVSVERCVAFANMPEIAASWGMAQPERSTFLALEPANICVKPAPVGFAAS